MPRYCHAEPTVRAAPDLYVAPEHREVIVVTGSHGGLLGGRLTSSVEV